MKAEMAFNVVAKLGESPLWDERENLLYWIDIPNTQIHCYNPADGTDRFIDAGQAMGCLALREGGGLISGMTDGIYFVDFAKGTLQLAGRPDESLEGVRFNDGKCDAAGRLIVGTMGAAGQKEPVGMLFRMDNKTMKFKMLLDGVGTSNGLAWTKDNGTFYYCDTPTKTVWAFDYDLSNGEISDRRAAIVVADGEGMPDGLTIDNEDMLWVAHWGGAQVARYNPATGKKIDIIEVGAKNVTCPIFGGENFDELYITTAAIGSDASEYPHAGCMFKVKPGVSGRASFRFKG